MSEHLPVVEANFQVYHDLMVNKVHEVLLVSSPFDAFFMEEDGRLASRIINEYQGLNLSRPPRLHHASSGRKALELLELNRFDLVITMPRFDDMDALTLSEQIRKHSPGLPIVLLARHPRAVPQAIEGDACMLLGDFYIWTGDPELLMAIIKNVEDHLNVAHDTERAKVRVLLLVEDSPQYRSYLLPYLYREVVRQTQKVLEEGLNEEHRLLKMRARPKILVADNFEKACTLYLRYESFMLGVISDMRFPVSGELDEEAGLKFLKRVRDAAPDIPTMLLSTEAKGRDKAKDKDLASLFAAKSDANLRGKIHDFFLNHLGFGDFTFRLPDGTIIGRAGNLREFEMMLDEIPDESLLYHARGNHFVNWIMARGEVEGAKQFWWVRLRQYSDVDSLRAYLRDCIHCLRRSRQFGVISQFDLREYDPEIMDFVRLGRGSIGGKARGLAFMAHMLLDQSELPEVLREQNVYFPKTLVIASEGFETFVQNNNLHRPVQGLEDREIAEMFRAGGLPDWLKKNLRIFLEKYRGPLAVRSSSLREDGFYKPYAGLFHTYMLANNDPDPAVRLEELKRAVKLVYASTWFAGPTAFAGRDNLTMSEDNMAVIIQELVGETYGDYFYPGVSGVAQSYNYYPVDRLRPEDGVAHIALGMGKTVVDGEQALRFSPAHPQVLPQFSTVDDVLANVQKHFYALDLQTGKQSVEYNTTSNLTRLEVHKVADRQSLQMLSSTYIPEEHRIRDGLHAGHRILTFAPLLKHNIFPLARMLQALTDIGRRALGVPVEIEFAVDLRQPADQSRFYFLQIRPMVAGEERYEVKITAEEKDRAFCFSHHALGHGGHELQDIVYVMMETFESRDTPEIAREISRFNAALIKENRPYLLIGPGRWGSADPYLGIPVQWQDIAGVGAMIELRGDGIAAEPSEGTHFFQNITSLGIPYITINRDEDEDRLDMQWLEAQKTESEGRFLRHVRLPAPFLVKIDWTRNCSVMYMKRGG